ncbi:MAG: alanyl-tRNA editing protein [Myxococcota bacterium]
MTERLHYADSLRLAFTAHVVAVIAHGERPALVLDRSAFYPESGGQLADRGVLSVAGHDLEVADVQIGTDGEVAHVLTRSVPPDVQNGASVEGHIDAARRRLHMAQHTGQHILSRALLDEVGAITVSSRLGASGCTVDVDREHLEPSALAAVFAWTNDVVDRDVPIRAYFPAPDELARLPLRKAPSVSRDVRVVAIGDVDITPCGGTHCGHTSAVGLVTLLGTERHKRRLRIHFAAGHKARALAQAESSALRALGRELSTAPTEVPSAVARLQAEQRRRTRQLKGLCEQMSEHLLDHDTEWQVLDLAEAPVDLVREVGKRAARHPRRTTVVAAATGEDDVAVVVLAVRGEEATFDCGAFVRALCAEHDGRGGGRPHRAEARLPAGTPWRAFLDTYRARR